MVSFEFLAIILTGLGLTASIFYYAFVLKNTNKTRQMQMILNIQSNRGKKEGILRYVNAMNMEWEDYEDFHRKYGMDERPEEFAEIYSYFTQFDDFGVMLKRGLVDLEFMYETCYPSIVNLWYKFKPIFEERRRRSEHSKVEMVWFQYIAEELERFAEKKGVTPQ